MPRIPFSRLPDDARLWVFPAHRPLTPQEEEGLLARVDAFLQGWAAHGTPLLAGRDWRERRFLLIAVDESSAPPSGCSIDSLVRILKEEGEALGMSFLDHTPVWYRSGEEIQQTDREAFRERVETGLVTAETPVFDHTVTRLSQLRNGDWEKPASRSWHGKAFFRM